MCEGLYVFYACTLYLYFLEPGADIIEVLSPVKFPKFN